MFILLSKTHEIVRLFDMCKKNKKIIFKNGFKLINTNLTQYYYIYNKKFLKFNDLI